MYTREIPRSEWRDFLDSFSRTYRGWLSTVEKAGRGMDPQVQAREQPLAGVSASVGNYAASVSLLIGREPGAHVGHTIPDVAHIRVAESESGACEALEIESADGTITQLRFRSAIAPELVDGVLPE